MTPSAILNSLENQHILIIGDVMLDRYLTGSVSRISPEAPVPVVLHSNTEDRLGGAANVALNVRALGSTPILCSVIGKDKDGSLFCDVLEESGLSDAGILHSSSRCTTVKTRILAGNHQMLRIDQEHDHELEQDEEEALLQRVRELLNSTRVNAIIFQDYNKGVLTARVIRTVIALARESGILTAVDPKKANFFAYKGVDLFKPNLKEIRDNLSFAVQPEATSLHAAAGFLQEKLAHRLTMITLSEKGLFLSNHAGAERIYPTVTRNVADVSGAGDTVISVATLGLAAGLDLEQIAALSNLAGGQVCEFPGVVPVRRDLLLAELEAYQVKQIVP